MPYDPNYPPQDAEIESAPLRSQFTSLKALIDAVPAGPQGPQGIQGPPGEVTQEGLDNAIIGALSQTSNNCNVVAMMGESADASYNQPQMQSLLNKMDELINALRR